MGRSSSRGERQCQTSGVTPRSIAFSICLLLHQAATSRDRTVTVRQAGRKILRRDMPAAFAFRVPHDPGNTRTRPVRHLLYSVYSVYSVYSARGAWSADTLPLLWRSPCTATLWSGNNTLESFAWCVAARTVCSPLLRHSRGESSYFGKVCGNNEKYMSSRRPPQPVCARRPIVATCAAIWLCSAAVVFAGPTDDLKALLAGGKRRPNQSGRSPA